MTRVAAIDCGTNSIRLLIADQQPGRPAVEVERRLELVRLGQDVDKTGVFHPDALRRTFAAVDDFAARIRAAGVERVRFVATSASRDVENRAEFVDGVRERLGVEVEVIPGAEEARLSFTGALAVLDQAGGSPDGLVLVTDIGGGSTELVLGRRDGTIVAATSLDVGSVRLRERFLTGDPITPEQRARAAAYVDEVLDAWDVDLGATSIWIGVAGTLTSMAAAALGLPEYDRTRVHGARLDQDDVASITDRFITSTVAQLTEIPTLPRMRAEVISGGAVVCERIARRVQVPLLVSETDILDAVVRET